MNEPIRIKKIRACKNPNYDCICVECGEKFQANRRTAMYCSDYCRNNSTHKRSSNKNFQTLLLDYEAEKGVNAQLSKELEELKNTKNTKKELDALKLDYEAERTHSKNLETQIQELKQQIMQSTTRK